MIRRGKLFWGLVFLGAIHLTAAFAGFIAPYGYATQDREHPYEPPARLRFVDCDGNFHLRPFIFVPQAVPSGLNAYTADCTHLAPIRLFVKGEPYAILGLFHFGRHLFGVDSPARIYVLGTDGFGRDQFSRLLYGSQVSLLTGLLAAILSLAIALVVGAVAGFFGGAVDDAAMRTAELVIAVPWLYLLLVVRSFLPLQLGTVTAFVLVVMVVGLVSWARPARLMRGVVMSARERNFVLAARGFGASDSYLLRRHLIPMTFSVALTQLAVLVPQFILAEVILSFLGLGIGEPFPSWGNMLAQAQQFHILISYWWMLLPGLALVPVIAAYHGFANALQENLKSEV